MSEYDYEHVREVIRMLWGPVLDDPDTLSRWFEVVVECGIPAHWQAM